MMGDWLFVKQSYPHMALSNGHVGITLFVKQFKTVTVFL